MLKVNEIFETIQGEGVYTGVPAVFVRLQGCPVGCPWCDTKHTWEVKPEQEATFADIPIKSVENEKWGAITESDLVKFCLDNYSARHIVITGGEPCMYDLTNLTRMFQAYEFTCQVETSGTYEVLVSEQTWITVSPKVNMKGGLALVPQALGRANEIKHPVGTHKDIDNLHELLVNYETKSDVVVALQPISQKERATALVWRSALKTIGDSLYKYTNI